MVWKCKRFLIVIAIIFNLGTSGCNVMKNSFEYDKYVEAESVLKSKVLSIKNINKIDRLLNLLRANNYYKKVESSNEYNENKLIIEYGVDKEFGQEDYINFWNHTDKQEIVISNAIYLFLLIDEVEKVEINLADPMDEKFVINRNDVEKVYGIALENYEISEESVQKLLTKDKVEELWCLVNS